MSGHVKVGGAWKTAAGLYVKVGGVWKTVSTAHTKVGGVWKQWFSSGPSDYELISTQTLSADAATVTFNSIPQTYTHLQLRVSARGSAAANYAALEAIFNGVAGYYTRHVIYNAQSQFESTSKARLADITYANAAAQAFGPAIIDFPYYTKSTKNISWKSRYGSADISFVGFTTGMDYMQPQAISSITLYALNSNLVAGSRFSLYGIKG